MEQNIDIAGQSLAKLDGWLPPEYKRDQKLPENKDLEEKLTNIIRGEIPASDEVKSISDSLRDELDAKDIRILRDGKKIEALRREAFTDPSTGYLNKNAFHVALKNIVKSRLENKGQEHEPITVVMLDLNYLKPINNVSYHGCGDKAINYLASYLSKNLRDSDDNTNEDKKRQRPTTQKDLFTRLSGGDEFAIIMKGITPEKARERLQPILKQMAIDSVADEFGVDSKGRKVPIQVSASFGVTKLPDSYPENMKSTGNIDTDVNDVINSTLKAASAGIKKDKMRSKKEASQVEGGFPACDDRQNAEEIIGEFLEKRIRKVNTRTTENGRSYTLHDATNEKRNHVIELLEEKIRKKQERRNGSDYTEKEKFEKLKELIEEKTSRVVPRESDQQDSSVGNNKKEQTVIVNTIQPVNVTDYAKVVSGEADVKTTGKVLFDHIKNDSKVPDVLSFKKDELEEKIFAVTDKVTDNRLNTPLHKAIEVGNEKAALKIIERTKPDKLFVRNNDDENALDIAIEKNMDSVIVAIAKKADEKDISVYVARQHPKVIEGRDLGIAEKVNGSSQTGQPSHQKLKTSAIVS